MQILLPVLIASAAALSACSTHARSTQQDDTGNTASADAKPEGSFATLHGSFEVETDAYIMNYHYPVEASRQPALADWLNSEGSRALDELAQRADEARADAIREGYPARQHYLGVTWTTQGQFGRWLSLSKSIETYSGGAHGNQEYDAIVWDDVAAKPLEPTDMFTSPDALRDAVRADFCEALAAARFEKRGVVLEPTSDDDPFVDCIDPLEAAIVFQGSIGERFDRIGFLIGPYLAGPYAEGSYVFNVPVTARVIAGLQPKFREAFVLVR